MNFRTLKETDIPALNKAFNKAFDNYFVDMQMSLEQFEERFLVKEKIDFDTSGAFFGKDGEMVSFIMHSVKEQNGLKTAYNAGTGVIPENRGRQLSVQLYERLLNELKKSKISKVLLEVITENHAAIKSYEKFGFEKVRTLNFFGVGKGLKTTSMKEAKEIKWQNEISYQDYSDFEPSWPCNPESFESIKNKLTCFGFTEDEKLKGYAIVNTKSGRISFLGVHKDYRKQGIGSALFTAITQKTEKDITVLNVPEDANECYLFLAKMGMEIKISQFEMVYNL